jgi:spore germination protein YaaH
MKIIENNNLQNPDRLTVGQKLLILNPTRTYTVRGSDTLPRIADRFGIKESELYAKNPYLNGEDKLYSGQLLAIKYDTPKNGTAYANGYYYNGTSAERLKMVLPYLTYLTVSAGKRDGDGIKEVFNADEVIKIANENKKPTLLRIYDNGTEFNETYMESIAQHAKKKGYSGITLAPYNATKNSKVELADFLIMLKKRLMEDDLLLFLELDGNGDADIPDICDGYVLLYEKCCLDSIPSFAEGEEAMLREYSESDGAIKTYLELPSLAYMDDEEITIDDAERLAHTSGKEILYDEDKKICYFNYNRYKAGKASSVRVAYESPENIKAKLDLIGKLGLMGISFDIMRIPTEYLMMFEASFNHPQL